MKVAHASAFLLWLCAVLTVPCWAQDTFDPKSANKMLDKMSIDLSVAEPTFENLQNAADTLIEYREFADTCITEAQASLKEIAQILPEDPSGPLSEDQQFLNQKKTELEERLAECRLFALRAQDAIAAFQDKAQSLKRSVLLTKGPTIFEQAGINGSNIPVAFHKTGQSLGLVFNVQSLSPAQMICLGLVLAIGLSLIMLKKVLANLIARMTNESLHEQFYLSVIASLHAHIWMLPIVTVLLGYAALLSWAGLLTPSLMNILGYLIGYWIYFVLVEFFFHTQAPAIAYFRVTPKYAKSFAMQLKAIGAILVTGLVCLQALESQNAEEPIYYLVRNGFFTLFALSISSALLTLNRMPKFLSHYKKTRAFISLLILLLTIIILACEWMGYSRLAGYMLTGVGLSFLAGFICYVLNDWTQSFFNDINHGRYHWHGLLKTNLGLTSKDTLPEVAGLKASAFIFFWGAFAIALYNIWQITHVGSFGIWYTLGQGYTIPSTEVTIIPSRFILAFVTFSVGILITRFLRNQIKCRVGSSKDKAEREAYGAIFGYSCFTFVLVVALLVAGFDLQGLAIIAGALSLGIGFGLQSIVSNFISGIILLLERPIKPGDRIAIGNDEGFVKSVNLRSTCITTLENNDVIVPNAELISGQVINQTFKNYHWRITVHVGVAYGSDVKLVESCLYQAANSHPEVIKDGPDAPKVFFLEFGDSSLNFEMWCVIRNVNLKLFVLSDINFEITQLFKAHGITIPFPQRDIHIKHAPEGPTKGNPIDE